MSTLQLWPTWALTVSGIFNWIHLYGSCYIDRMHKMWGMGPYLGVGTCPGYYGTWHCDKVDDFDRICNPGFEGPLCEININECIIHNINCSGQGRCMDGDNTYTCNCFSGYTGSECQTNINDCIGVNCSGNRVCLDGVNSYECVCSAEYLGTDCNLSM